MNSRGGDEMAIQNEKTVNRTAKPIVAGIFQIIIGSIALLAVIGLVFAAIVAVPFAVGWAAASSFLLLLIALPFAIIGGLTITGGISALQRKRWGWALAGAIAAFFPCNVLGITSVVLVAVSRDEFTA
jgi:hypothetical protein